MTKKRIDFSLVIFSYFCQFAGSIALTKILTNHLSKNDFGNFSLYQSLVAFILILPFSSLNEGISRSQHKYEVDQRYNDFSGSVTLINLLFFLPYVLIGLLIAIFSHSYSPYLVLFILLFSLSEIYRNSIQKVYNTAEQRVMPAIVISISFLLRIAFITILYFCNLKSITLIFLAYGLSNISVFIVGSSDKTFRPNFNSVSYTIAILKEILTFSAPLIVWASFTWLQNMSGRWVINFVLSAERVAEYTLIQNIAVIPVTVITSIFGTYFIPKIYKRHELEKEFCFGLSSKLITYIVIFYVILILITSIFSKSIIIILASQEYANISYLLPIILVGSFLQTAGVVLSYPAFAFRKTKLLLLSGILPGIINLIANLLVVDLLNIAGAVISYISSSLIYSLLVLKVYIKIKHDVKKGRL